MARNYEGTDANLTSGNGGSERITIAANIGQGADVPCRKVLITQPYGNTGVARVNVGTAASATLGIDIPHGGSTVATAPLSVGPIEINVSNTNLLNFYSGTNGDFVDILYLK